MSSICSYEVNRRPQLRHSRRRRMVAPSRLSRESTTRSWLSEQKGHLIAPVLSFLGVQRDVEAQEELLQASRVLDVDRQVPHGVHHPVLVVFHLEADQHPAGALEVGAAQRQLDAARQLAAAVGAGGGRGVSRGGGRAGGDRPRRRAWRGGLLAELLELA